MTRPLPVVLTPERRRTVGAAIIAVAVAIPTTAAAIPEQCGYTCEHTSSHRRVHRVFRAAKRAGASERQARRAMRRRNPSRNIPVRLYVKGGSKKKKAKNVATVTTATGESEKCGDARAYYPVENEWGWIVAEIMMKQRWCWDGKKVTRVKRTSFDRHVNLFGKVSSVEGWKGPVASADFYDDLKHNPHPRARHASRRKFDLIICPFLTGIVCWSQLSPILVLSKRYNGHYVPAILWGDVNQ